MAKKEKMFIRGLYEGGNGEHVADEYCDGACPVGDVLCSECPRTLKEKPALCEVCGEREAILNSKCAQCFCNGQ